MTTDNLELFRMEKSVLTKRNFDELASISGDAIPEALLEYICYEHQYNIFGYGLLDPVEFARKFRFSHNYLMSRHPSPYHASLRKSPKDVCLPVNRRRRIPEEACLNWDSRIENALFILGNYSMNITGTAVMNERLLVRHQEFLRVLESFSVIQDMRTGKLLYAYKLDDRFRRNLSSLYLTISCESVIALRRNRLQPLYVFLMSLRDALFSEGRTSTTEDNTPDFEYLCSISGVSASLENKYRKRNLNLCIKKIQECTELQFSVRWERGAGVERYTPIFTFSPTPEQVVGLPCDRLSQVRRSNERILIAINEFQHNLVEACPFEGNRYTTSAEEFFFQWIKTEDPKQVRMMEFALEKTFINLGCGIPSNIQERVKTFGHLARKYGKDNFETWLRLVFVDSHNYFMPPFRTAEGTLR